MSCSVWQWRKENLKEGPFCAPHPQRHEIRHDYSFTLFTYYVQVVTSWLKRSGYQVSLNDPTSHHHFATLRPRQNQSRWPSALKLAGCNEPIDAYNLYISDFFYIDDLRSGQFLDLPIISQGGKSTGSFLTNTRCNSNLYHGWHDSWLSQTT